jgi:3-deoxy-manno-octulosonate cytidylyltransferase (CMP-KDO synthetase)
VFDAQKEIAHWFSKNTFPSYRKEEKLREQGPSRRLAAYRPYGYKREMLERFVTLPEGKFEKLEGLEQLRVIESRL